MSILKISKTKLLFFTYERQKNKNRDLNGSSKYTPDVLKKKTKILDIFITDKTCFIKIESSQDMDKEPFSWEKKTNPHHWFFLL